MRILIATDAWYPQVNGVVRTLNAVIGELRARGHEVHTINPEGRPSRPMPFYSEISLTSTSVAQMTVAAYNARSPLDAVEDGVTGCIADTLDVTFQ